MPITIDEAKSPGVTLPTSAPISPITPETPVLEVAPLLVKSVKFVAEPKTLLKQAPPQSTGIVSPFSTNNEHAINITNSPQRAVPVLTVLLYLQDQICNQVPGSAREAMTTAVWSSSTKRTAATTSGASIKCKTVQSMLAESSGRNNGGGHAEESKSYDTNDSASVVDVPSQFISVY